MVGAELGLTQRERLLEQRQRTVELTGGLIAPARGCSCCRACWGGRARAWTSSAPASPQTAAVPGRAYRRPGSPGEVAHAHECVGVVGAELRLQEAQRLLIQRQGPVELTGSLIVLSEVVHADECVGVVGAELGLPSAPASPQTAAAPRSSLPARHVADSEVVHADECVGVVGAELRLPQRQRLLIQRQSPVELTGRQVADGEVVHALSVSGWSGPSLDFRSASVSSNSGMRTVELTGILVAHGKVVHALSVSRWSGPSFDFPAPASPRAAAAHGRASRLPGSPQRGCSC